MNKNKRIGSFLFIALFALFMSASVINAEPAKPNGAKTSAPPETNSIQIQGIFDPNDIYLQKGWNSIGDNGNHQIGLSATTIANQYVDQIGVTYYLQKWTGSTWEDVDRGVTQSFRDDDQFTNTLTYTGESGYYYRGVTIHWIKKGNVYEDGTVTSSTVLLK
ncbi:hypothetical protein [Paenibacillus sp. RC67]|uniref:hypothetical protein n=1 Tax=Paenibacillus sp. RC67 TaxID=3039392 RepID=UPI0024ADB6CD|nr:hypothetical protein [Paenibacillus sp. RC67]